MEYQQIGQTGITASRVALGVMRMMRATREEAAEAVRAALDCGVTFFDTADIYGMGASSRALGQALRDNDVARDQVIIQTKFGIVPGKRYDFSRDHLMGALESELEALGVDYVDIALLHRPDPLVDLDEFAGAIAEMVSAGMVRHVGVSNMSPWQVDLLQSALDARLEVNQLQFSLAHAQAVSAGLHVNMEGAADAGLGVLEHARLRHMTVQAWSPFQFGTFAGCFIGDERFPELNAALDAVAAEHGTTPTAVAAAWILHHPAKIQVVCGSMSPEHISAACAGAEIALTRQQWWDLYLAAGNDLP